MSNLNTISAGHKIVKGHIADYLDVDLDAPLDTSVKENEKFKAMTRLLETQDIVLLSDFARLTKYPNRLHSMAQERKWVAIHDGSKVIGYRNPNSILTRTEYKTGVHIGLKGVIKDLLVNKGYFKVVDLVNKGFRRESIIYTTGYIRSEGFNIKAHKTRVGKASFVEAYELIIE